ncbi:hypothetical protein [Acrocarpospora sp. B8E8]|uniref:hypothetical protein n=1 Tax=Acrocarpospora sp. B8E8 TaxID=3153572 RepID=UPI00325C56CC
MGGRAQRSNTKNNGSAPDPEAAANGRNIHSGSSKVDNEQGNDSETADSRLGRNSNNNSDAEQEDEGSNSDAEQNGENVAQKGELGVQITPAGIIALTFTLSPLILSTIRIVATAKGDTGTIAILLQTLDPVAIVISTIITLWPYFIALVVAIFVFSLLGRIETTKGSFAAVFIAGAVCVTLGRGLFGNLGDVAATLGVVAGILTYGFSRKKDSRIPFAMLLTSMFALMATAVTVLPYPWLPPEAIERKSDVAQTVYVLAVDDMSMKVLHLDGTPEIISLDDIAKRKYCRMPPVDSFPLGYINSGISFLSNRPKLANLPACPSQ